MSRLTCCALWSAGRSTAHRTCRRSWRHTDQSPCDPMRDTLTPFQIDAALRRLARPQLGLVTIAQAAKEGIGRSALARRREVGSLESVFAGVMRLASAPISPQQRVLAAALAVPGSTITATSAGIAHGMPIGPTSGDPIVAVGPSRSARTAGITIIRQHVALPSRPWHTARVATPEATLVLLPRFVDDGTVERCLDHCLVHRLTTVARVRSLIDELPFRTVVGRRLLLDLLDERRSGIGHRSGLEQRVGRWLTEAGLGGWHRNYEVPVAGDPVEVDFAWPDAKVALEISPFFTHGTRAAQDRDVERRRLLTGERWSTVEATDPDLESRHAFEAIVVTLRDLIRPTSGALRGAGRNATHLTSPPLPELETRKAS